MNNENTTIKSLVELFGRNQLSSDSFKVLKESNELVNIVKNRIETNGLFCLDVQCGGGKNYSGREVGNNIVEDDGTITFIGPSHQLLGEQKDKLIKSRDDDGHDLDKEKINRIRGFRRAYPEYPAEENENYGLDFFENMTEVQRKIKTYYEFNRIKPGHIHSKFGEEAGLDSNPYDEQFNQYSGKFNLMPTSFIGDQSVMNIARSSEGIFVDEETVGQTREEKLRASNNVEKLERITRQFFDNNREYLEEGIEAVNESENFAIDDLTFDQFKEMVLEGEEFHSLFDDYDRFIRKTRKLSAVKRMTGEELNEEMSSDEAVVHKDMVSNVDHNEFSMKDNPIENRSKLGIWRTDLAIAGKVFTTALSRKFEEEENIGGRYLEHIPEFGHLETFSKKLKYHSVEVLEEVKRAKVGGDLWEGVKDDLEPYEKGEDYELGFIEEDGRIKIYRREGGYLYISQQYVDSQDGRQPFIRYWKNAVYDIFPLVGEKPVFFLNATFDRSDVEELIPNYVKSYRARQLGLYELDDFDEIYEEGEKDRLNKFDKYLIHNTDLAIDYIPPTDNTTSVEEVRSRVPEPEIEFEIISTAVENKDGTVERLKVDRTSEDQAGTFTKSSGSYGSMKADLNKGIVPDELEYLAERGWAVISYKPTILSLRANSENFDKENTAYYYGSRGQDKLKGKNLLVMGTPYNPPGELKMEFMRTFKTGYSIFDENLDNAEAVVTENDWREYDNPMLQTFQRKYSKDEQYQMIHRVRPLDDDYEGEIKVMGAIPDRIKEELGYKYEGRRLIEICKENLRERVEEEIGIEKVVERAKTDRVKPDDIVLDGSKATRIHENLLEDIGKENKELTFDDEVLRKRKDIEKEWTEEEVDELAREFVTEHDKEILDRNIGKNELAEWMAEVRDIGFEKAREGIDRISMVEWEQTSVVPPEYEIRVYS